LSLGTSKPGAETLVTTHILCAPRLALLSTISNPARGGLFIAPAQPPPSFFLFFSGAGPAPLPLSNSPPAAPLKNKKKAGGSRSSINRSPLTGFLALGSRRWWYEGTKSSRYASISSSQPSPPNMWVMTSRRVNTGFL
jgi:hypothetical protein